MTPHPAVMSISSQGQAAWYGTFFSLSPPSFAWQLPHFSPCGGGAGGSDKLYLIRDSHQPHLKGFSYRIPVCHWGAVGGGGAGGPGTEKGAFAFPVLLSPPQPHSNLESRDLGDRARGWVGDSEIAPRSGAEWAVPAGRADPRQRSPRPRDKCTALPDSMGSLDKSEGVLFGAWQTR